MDGDGNKALSHRFFPNDLSMFSRRKAVLAPQVQTRPWLRSYRRVFVERNHPAPCFVIFAEAPTGMDDPISALLETRLTKILTVFSYQLWGRPRPWDSVFDGLWG